MKKPISYLKASILAGAVGDALGWPLEFKDIGYIKGKYGKQGCTELQLNHQGIAVVTDDTQMTLFTLKGIIDHLFLDMTDTLKQSMHQSYMQWYKTQYSDIMIESNEPYDLLRYPQLYFRRAPGITCLTALKSEKMGTVDDPLNDSKGCGGVMRVAPIGYFYDPEAAFEHGCDVAAITHGHPLGYLSSGAFTFLMSLLFDGQPLTKAVAMMIERIDSIPTAQRLKLLLKKAVELSQLSVDDLTCIEQLGEGWVAEEALAIAVFCSIRYENDLNKALIAAVNHSGDSDSTGSITGNILGAILGMDGIDPNWIEKLDVTEIVNDFIDFIDNHDK